MKNLYRNVTFTVLSLLLLLLSPQDTWSREPRFEDLSRVVAISDVHGAYDAMLETLQNAGILGADHKWSGGDAMLVIVGDILDRGPKSRAVMDLLMRLEGEAELAGGRVQVLIGNHEAMIMTGDMRYVSGPEYAAFAAEEDVRERQQWFDLYVERQGADAETLRASFDKAFPRGYFAMKHAFRPDGQYGKWLLEKDIMAVINRTAFVHGGLSPAVARLGLAGINEQARSNLKAYVGALDVLTDAGILSPIDSHYRYENTLKNYLPALDEDAEILQAVDTAMRLGQSKILGIDGPLWNRSNVRCQGIIEEDRLEQALAAVDADRLVVGHTPTPNRSVLQRFDGRLIEIDTGMLNFYYRGIGHALIIEADKLSVVNQEGTPSLVPVEHPRAVGRRPGNLSADGLADLLRNGDIVSVDKDRPSIADFAPRTEVTISDGSNTVTAVFDKRRGKRFYPNTAAYLLDRLLNLDMVPVAVNREVDGDVGSLQFLPGNTIDETERSATGQGGGASCAIVDQWAAMYVFDVLIHNEGRSQPRMLYDTSTWSLMLIEHDGAFANKKGRPRHLKNASLTISPGWQAALADLSDEVLQAELGDVLDKRRLRALSLRRDELLNAR